MNPWSLFTYWMKLSDRNLLTLLVWHNLNHNRHHAKLDTYTLTYHIVSILHALQLWHTKQSSFKSLLKKVKGCPVIGWVILCNKFLKIWILVWTKRFCITFGMLTREHREGGLTGFSKDFKTLCFKRYWKILPRGYFNGSRTSPIFFFL